MELLLGANDSLKLKQRQPSARRAQEEASHKSFTAPERNDEFPPLEPPKSPGKPSAPVLQSLIQLFYPRLAWERSSVFINHWLVGVVQRCCWRLWSVSESGKALEYALSCKRSRLVTDKTTTPTAFCFCFLGINFYRSVFFCLCFGKNERSKAAKKQKANACRCKSSSGQFNRSRNSR